MEHCPLHCVNAGCPHPDFIERNGTWLITVLGVLIGCVGTVLTYVLKSRCKNIRGLGLSCDREVPEVVDVKELKIEEDRT